MASLSLEELKGRFTTVPILHHPDSEYPFMVEVEASCCDIGAVLSQCHGDSNKHFPCAFFSQKWTSAAMNYNVGNWELLSI